MCTNNDLRAQTGATSRDVMPVMGGVVFGLGLLSLTAAIAVALKGQEVQPARVVAWIGFMTVILGAFIMSHGSLERRLKRVEASACSCPAGTNGRTSPLTADNVSSIDEARFP